MISEQSERKLAHLLWQERECFQAILAESQKVLDRSCGTTTEPIYDLLVFREEKIAELKELQIHLRGCYEGDPYSFIEPQTVKEEINDIARILVGIDAKIMDTLQSIKVKCVRELSTLKEKQRDMAALSDNSRKHGRLINILQE